MNFETERWWQFVGINNKPTSDPIRKTLCPLCLEDTEYKFVYRYDVHNDGNLYTCDDCGLEGNVLTVEVMLRALHGAVCGWDSHAGSYFCRVPNINRLSFIEGMYTTEYHGNLSSAVFNLYAQIHKLIKEQES